MNLSRGERPVCFPVRTTSGPSAAIAPSSAAMARSYSSATERFVWTLPPSLGVGAGLVIVTIGVLDCVRRRRAPAKTR
jgi:hypothetical protein